jgi:hypothetical protein
MARKGDYLFKRSESQNWWIRFQYSGELAEKFGRQVAFSLGTPDRTEAELRAIPEIHAHKLAVLTMRAKKDGTLRITEGPQYQPGRIHHLPDGRRLLASKDRLFYLGRSDEIIGEEPNRPTASLSIPITPENKGDAVEIRRAKLRPDPDTDILRTWIEPRRIRPRVEADALRAFQLFKILTNGKHFSNATRADGRALANYLLSSRTRVRPSTNWSGIFGLR